MNELYPTVVDFAYELVNLHKEVIALRAEVEYLNDYKKKYIKLLSSSTDHNIIMMKNVLTAILTKE